MSKDQWQAELDDIEEQYTAGEINRKYAEQLLLQLGFTDRDALEHLDALDNEPQ